MGAVQAPAAGSRRLKSPSRRLRPLPERPVITREYLDKARPFCPLLDSTRPLCPRAAPRRAPCFSAARGTTRRHRIERRRLGPHTGVEQMKDVDGDGWHSYVYWSHSFRHGQPAIVRRALEVSRSRMRGVPSDHAPPWRTKPDEALDGRGDARRRRVRRKHHPQSFPHHVHELSTPAAPPVEVFAAAH